MTASGSPRGALRHLPNATTIARLVAVPVLLVLAWQREEAAFGVLLVAALVAISPTA